MPGFEAEYTINDFVEFQNDNGAVENKFGFIRGVSFRGDGEGGHIPTYTIHLCNKGEVLQEITDGEVIRRWTVDERKRA